MTQSNLNETKCFRYEPKKNSLAVWDDIHQNYFPVKMKKIGNYGNQIFYVSETVEEDYISVSFNQDQSKASFFYKKIDLDFSQRENFWQPEKVNYYRKWLDLEEVNFFDFTENDQVEKIAGKWIWINKKSWAKRN